MSDIKVGDVVSIFDEMSQSWSCVQMASNYACSQLTGLPHDIKWQHGIHESLIPEGFAIVPVEPTQEMMTHISGESWHESRENYYKLLKAAPKPTDK